MDKYIYNDTNSLWYERYRNFYLPCLSLPEQKSYMHKQAEGRYTPPPVR